MTTEALIWALLVGVALNLLLALWLLLRPRQPGADELAHRQLLQSQNQQIAQRVEHVEGELRREMGDNARVARQEIQQTLGGFQEAVSRQSAEAARTQNTQLDAFAQQLLQLRGTLGEDAPAEGVAPYSGASGTGQINVVFPVTPQDGRAIPAAVASRADGYTSIATRL